jgi:hypothetical protein
MSKELMVVVREKLPASKGEWVQLGYINSPQVFVYADSAALQQKHAELGSKGFLSLLSGVSTVYTDEQGNEFIRKVVKGEPLGIPAQKVNRSICLFFNKVINFIKSIWTKNNRPKSA